MKYSAIYFESGQVLPRPLGANSRSAPWSTVRVGRGVGILLSFPFLPGGDLVELYQTKETDSHTDRDVIPGYLALPESLAQTL